MIQSVLRLQKKYNVDWGLDFTWCGAAREFAPNANHCMVFNEPVFHNKTATQQWRGLFVRKGYKVLNEAGLRLDFRFPVLATYMLCDTSVVLRSTSGKGEKYAGARLFYGVAAESAPLHVLGVKWIDSHPKGLSLRYVHNCHVPV